MSRPSPRHLALLNLALLFAAFAGDDIFCPPPSVRSATQPETVVVEPSPGLRRFAYRVARPIYDQSARSKLYISGYAGRRPAPRGPGLFSRPAPVSLP